MGSLHFLASAYVSKQLSSENGTCTHLRLYSRLHTTRNDQTPVVVISRTATHSSRLCTIVPLSTTAPQPIETWHVPLLINPLKNTHTEPKVWAKCDMLYTVSFDRLDLPAPLNQPHSQRGLTPRLSSRDLDAIFRGVKNYLPGISLSVEEATREGLSRP